ncbi:stage II sporulation protein M [Bacillus pumilus]|uniref:stage II sporulation protein M n=1 Tax=Bacillus pumilus TaxID=1408 RepID=UPI000DCA40EB|nr:stage II sporulation protein M [Bacillus pumilus]MBU8608807.1 stage II sporulation protein M [Bacillus pumilus]MCW4682143.1 stage II sporulation protein M [Bacillus pumilus]MED1109233.1 stage II sporulation protein M [Bacillus pumilus]RAU02032.1 stage II sporulation protein M [Bacillus pumilus]WFO47995.1 stage II sporulation protein M [Bacillus pumilus]
MKINSKRNFLKSYLKIFLVFIIFFLGGFSLSVFASTFIDSIDFKSNINIDSYQEIFFNNLFVSILILVSGIVSLGLLSSIIIFLNGFFLGAFFISYTYIYGIDIALFYIIFHSPMEIIGLFLFYFVSFDISKQIMFYIISKDKISFKPKGKIYFSQLTTGFLLLFIASIIEFYFIKI